MWGSDKTSGSLFSYMDVEARIPRRHPLRTIQQIVNEVLMSLGRECCSAGLSGSAWTMLSGTTRRFSKNRGRLLEADVAAKFLEAVLRHPQVKRFLSDDHFSVDGTLSRMPCASGGLP